MKNLRGRNAILTSASYGIGPHVARALAPKDVNLALTARSANQLNKVTDISPSPAEIPLTRLLSSESERDGISLAASYMLLSDADLAAVVEWTCHYFSTCICSG